MSRVPQHDALGAAKAGDVGVERLRVLALGHLEHAAALDARALGQRAGCCASSALSFIGPNLLKSGSIQIGCTRITRTRNGIVEQRPCTATSGAGSASAAGTAPTETATPITMPTASPVTASLDPLAERLVRQPVRVLAHEALVVRQRQIDHEADDAEDREVEPDDEEPLPADRAAPRCGCEPKTP